MGEATQPPPSLTEKPVRVDRVQWPKRAGIVLAVALVLYIGIHGAVRGWELQRRLVCASILQRVGTSAETSVDPRRDICPTYAGESSNYLVVPPVHPSAPVNDATVIAYEPMSNHGGEGGNVLFGDGHVKFVLAADYDELVHGMATVESADAPTLRAGMWRAWLDSPGGELPFGLQLLQERASWKAAILNGAERIDVPVVEWRGDDLVLSIPYYDSTIRAKSSADGARLDGEWKKHGKGDRWVRLPFHAVAGEAERFPPTAQGAGACRAGEVIAGRWTLRFAGDDSPAVGVFEVGDACAVVGTILTTTGDYRYLAGDVCREQPESRKPVVRLRLSAFDGAHAFLILATTEDGGTLRGDFWSGDTYHDTWTGKRDPGAELPDAFALTRGVEGAKLEDIAFPDLDGKKRSLADPAFAGKARVIEIFGTWCPNCNDASHYLVELHKKYKGRGLNVLGLAFEYSGDFPRDAEQVRAFAAHHKIEYPILLAGDSDRERASAALPIIDKLRAYPTLLALDGENKIRATYTGFSGPATGEEYQRFRTRFESIIEKLLAE